MKKVKYYVIPAAILGILSLAACEKALNDATETTDSAEAMTTDMVALSSLTDAIQDMVSLDPNLQLKNGVPIIDRQFYTYIGKDSVFTDGDGVRIRFDFDNSTGWYLDIADDPSPGTGSVGGDGSTRWGSGIIELDKPFSDPGCVITLELDRYILLKSGTYYQIDDGTKMLGDKYELILTRTGTDTWDLDYNFSFRYRKGQEDVSDKAYNGGTFHITTKDGGSEGFLDDEVTITGTASDCRNYRGRFYEAVINKTLRRIVDPGCSKTFVEGEIEIKNDGSKTSIKADFGDGSCDNDVVVTLPGNIKKTITIE